ncbi:hypothetical protein [Streptomyces sp. NPDC005281]|uniref:hypothetical protein n=1 Tax=Streptomyces sp. NPDC005281 TaxID=3155712 RepID=UPI0033A4FC37
MKFTHDLFNNLRRVCSIRGDASGRVWKVRAAMRDAKGERHYLCLNWVTGEFRVVHRSKMANLY